MEIYTKFWLRDLNGKGHFEYLAVSNRIILICNFKNNGLCYEIDTSGSGSCKVAGTFKQSNDINFGLQKRVAELLRR